MPLKKHFSPQWTARAIGCSQEQLSVIAKSPSIAKLLGGTDGFTWEALLLAAQRQSELKKVKKGAHAQQQIPSTAVVMAPIEPPAPQETFVQIGLRGLAEAKQLALDSKYEEAEQRLLALTTTDRLPPEVIEDALLELGRAYIALNKAEAEGIFRRLLELTVQRVGRGQHLRPIITSLAEFYLQSGDYDSFLKLSNDNADIYSQLTPEERLVGIIFHAAVEFSAGSYEHSIGTLRVFSDVKSDTHISTSLDAYRYDLLGMNYSALYEMFLAERAFKCALRCCRSDRDGGEDMLPRILMHQGIVCRREGLYQDAIKAYTEAIKLLRRQEKSKSILFADIMSSMGVVYRHLGNIPSAEKCFEQATDVYHKQSRTDTPEYAKVLTNFGVLRMEQKKYAKAEALLSDARDIFDLKTGGNADALVVIQMHIGNLHAAKGDLELAQVAFEECVQLAEGKLGCDSARSALAKDALGDCLLMQGECKRAAGLYAEALDVFERVGGTASPDFIRTSKKLDAARSGHHILTTASIPRPD
jgi:tetratricopeptide (TPR) repeat protein